MTTSSSSSYDWVREIKPDLKQLDAIPLTGATPPFPWDDFSSRLAQTFDCKEFTIQPGEIAWRTKENLYEGMGDTPFPLTISIPSIKGHVSWIMPAQEIPLLAALLLAKESHPLPLQDQALSESFYRFSALEALYNFTQVAFDQTLSPLLTHQTELPDQNSLCWEFSLQIENHKTWGRMIISPEFRQSWVEHFAKSQSPSPLSEQMAQLATVILHLEAGKTQLNLAEWMSLKLGDFLTLDSCSLDTERLDGRITLTLNNKSIFRAKLKDGTLKILELPLLHEVETSMAKQPEDEDDFSDLDSTDDNSELEENDEDDLFSDDDDDLFNEETEERDQNSSEEDLETPATPEKTKPLAPENIPVTVVVEVGQAEMTMEQLLKLEPGNLLDLNLNPQNGVDLTINGKMVGKGELIRIGDVIGVRILQLGHS